MISVKTNEDTNHTIALCGHDTVETQINLKSMSFLWSTVWISSLTGLFKKCDKSSSLYPTRKYSFLGNRARDTSPAIIIMFCRLLMITSDKNKLCHVPSMNLRMNMSSIVVWEVNLSSSSKLPGINKNES